MQINEIAKFKFDKSLPPPPERLKDCKTSYNAAYSPLKKLSDLDSSHTRANFAPNLSFTGNAPKIKNAYIITGEEEDIPLLVTKKNESYVIDFDSQTEIIYGIDAINYLNSHDEFEYDTQVIFPKKAEGSLETDGKTVSLPENSAVLINAGTKTKIAAQKGYPMVVVTKKDYDWYERYGKEAKDINIRNKFSELIFWNSHLYNGEFTPNTFLSEELKDEKFLSSIGIDKYASRNHLVYALHSKLDSLNEKQKEEVVFAKNLMDKLYETGIVEARNDGFVIFKNRYTDKYQEQYLKERGFTEKEIKTIMPVYSQARQARADSKFAIRNNAEGYDKDLTAKMKEKGILYNNKKDADKFIYWKEIYGNENDLRNAMYDAGFNGSETDRILESWKKENISGFDISGLKFINENLAVYNLNDKLNNWTHEKTNWVSNSTVLQSSNQDTPFIGVSMVQFDDLKPEKMRDIRKEEKLHAHPNLEEKRQTEIYVISSGAAALNVVKGGKSKVQILKEGDLAVVGPGVLHCVNSILGEYEHIVAQVPSAFQYGFSFKSIVEPPEDYNETLLEEEAFRELEEYRKETENSKDSEP